MLASTPDKLEISRELADPGAIAELHRRVYVPEYGMNETFVSRVAAGVEDAVAAGWPERSGAVWIVARGERQLGSLALTAEQERTGRLRWFVLDPSLRGRGLGRRLVGDLLVEARSQGFDKLVLETFAALTAAAHIYRTVGFSLIWERERADWGPPIVYQGYELQLR